MFEVSFCAVEVALGICVEGYILGDGWGDFWRQSTLEVVLMHFLMDIMW